ncbi:ABC transporter, transmembrane region [Serinicoccus hydrothermalis]|uniref:ABC transporter, transmembrane region n=1 Tax=Serinicoccus hydrothermalis TaxID=1758689 RepID=A0A1B1NEG0_9MICO|nr:ABC transporter ATP-binding protein [Serinicoccus hydrothermalis]ANS79839.1 ABC transporter, transmembrane region [Serinicoccus hydrothermalis]
MSATDAPAATDTPDAPDAPDAQGSPLRRTLRLVLPHLDGQRTLLAGGGVLLLAEVLFRVLEPWPTKLAIDALTRSLGADLADSGPQASLQLLLACGLATIAIIGLRAVCNYGATVAFALGGSRVATRLRARVFDHVQGLSRSYHGRARSGDVVHRLVADVGRLQEVAVSAGMPLVVNVFTLVAMLGVMTWLDPVLALIVLVAILVFGLFSRLSTGKITTASRKTRRSEGELANVAQETLTGMTHVQAYGMEGDRSATFQGSNDRSLKDGVVARRLAAGLERRTDVLVGIATAAVLMLGGMRVLQGAMTPGDMVIFLTYLKTSMKPLRDLAKYTGRIARASASGERVADLLDETPDIVSPADPVRLGVVRGGLELRDVTLEFVPGLPVLRGVDLAVAPGERVAVVGPSGSGKSTVASLLLRLLDPGSGSVHLDGTDLRELDLRDLRGQIALVQQEAVLFTGTIEDNIRQGRPEASDHQVRRAARLARVTEFTDDLPDGLQTVVSERGGSLSGGQRQRISLARAFLRDAPVLLLDEPTTGLDPDNVTLVGEAIAELSRGRTTVMITHDLDIARAADRVVVLEQGRVTWSGPPEQAPLDGVLEESRG